MSIDWIDDAWRACNEAHFFDVKAPETIKKYNLAIFKGCVSFFSCILYCSCISIDTKFRSLQFLVLLRMNVQILDV